MTWSLILFIFSLIVITVMFAVRSYETNTGKVLVKKSVRYIADDVIYEIGVAVIKNIARILKLISKWASELPKLITKYSHMVWGKVSGKVDRFFDRLHIHQGIDKEDE